MKYQRKKHRLRRALACLMLSCLIVDQVQSTMFYVKAEENSVQEKTSDTKPVMDLESPSGEELQDTAGTTESGEEPNDTAGKTEQGEASKDTAGTTEPEEGGPKDTEGEPKPGETSQDAPEGTEPKEETPQVLAAGSLKMEERGWSSEVESFVISIHTVLPAGTSGNRIILNLPQYIKVSDKPPASDILTEIKEESSSDGGTTVTLVLADAVTARDMELDLGISQKEFREKAKPDTGGNYKISAEYKNSASEEIQASDELTFTASIYSMTYSGRIDIGEPGNPVDFESFNGLYTHFEMTSPYGIDETTDWFSGEIYMPAEVVEYLVLLGVAKQYIQPDGSLLYPYNTTLTQDMDEDPQVLKMELPILLNKERIIQEHRGQFQWIAEIRPNGLERKPIEVTAYCVQPVIKYTSSFNSSKEVSYSAAYATKEKDGSYILTDKAYGGVINVSKSKGILGEVALGAFNYHFILPEGLIWAGSPEYYNTNTREVVMPLVENTEAKGNDKKFQLKEDLRVRLENDMTEEEHLAGKKIFSIINPYFEGSYLGFPFRTLDGEVGASIELRGADTGLRIEGERVVQGSTDTLLYKLNRGSDTYNDINEAFMLDGEWQQGSFDVNSFEFIGDWKSTGAEFYYTTSGGMEIYTLTELEGNHVVYHPGEEKHLRSWGLYFKNGLKKDALQGCSIEFRGEVKDSGLDGNAVKAAVTLKTRIGAKAPEETGQITNFITAKSGEVTVVQDIISDLMEISFEKPEAEYYPDMEAYKNFCYLNFGASSGGAALKPTPADLEVELPDNMRINRVEYNGDPAKFGSYTYTTNAHPEEQTSEQGLLELLGDNIYFTSLKISMKDVYDAESIELGARKYNSNEYNYDITEDTEDRIGVKVTETDLVQAQHVTETFKLHKYGEFGLGGFSGGGKQNVGLVTPDQTEIEVKFSPMLMYWGNYFLSYPNNWYQEFKIYNPTFYLEIPNYLTMKEDSYELKGYGDKKPKITRLKGKSDDTYIVKIQYYGDPKSETGLLYDPSILLSKQTIKLEQSFIATAEIYAPRGDITAEIKEYYDFSNTFDYYLKDHQSKGTYSIRYNNNNMEEIQDDGITIPVTVTPPAEITMDILKSGERIYNARVGKSSEVLSTEASVQDGESYLTSMNFVNNASPFDGFSMYIPIPRKGKSYGVASEHYEWDAALKTVEASMTEGSFSIDFSTDPSATVALPGHQDPPGMYVPRDQVKDLSEVTMIRVSADHVPGDARISVNATLESLTEKKEVGTQDNEIFAYVNYKDHEGVPSMLPTNTVIVHLTDSTVEGNIWMDSNKDGRMDEDEDLLTADSGQKFDIALEKKDGSYQDVADSKDGTYSFQLPSLKPYTGIRITLPETQSSYRRTFYRKSGVENSRQSYFIEREGDKEQEKFAEISLDGMEKLKYLNLGVIQAQRIVLDPKEYTIRKGKTETISHTLEPADPPQKIQYVSMDPSIATVDKNGVVTAVKPGETQVELSYEVISDVWVKERVDIHVESNDAPVIHANDVELNVGDIWNPLDPNIVSVTDDHDTDISLDKIEVNNPVPVDIFSKSFFDIFRINMSGKTTTIGTYEVIYSYTDSDGNRAEKKIRVKVHGLPVFRDLKGDEYDTENMPPFYERLDNSLDPYQDIKVYWQEASDQINGKPQERLIDPADNTTGSLSLVNTVDSEGKPVTGIEKAGKYNGDYEAVTPKGGSRTVNRTVYIRGKVDLTGNNIAIPDSAKQTSFANLEELLKVYGKQLDLKAGVDTPDKDGNITHIDLSDKITAKTDISALDFSLKEGEERKTLELELQVTDKAENYTDKTKELTLYLTVQKVVGKPPVIEFPTSSLDRIENDKIAAAGGIYQELLDFANIYDFDKDGNPMDSGKGIRESGIKEIHKVNPADLSNQDEIDVKDEAALEQMLKTIGIYRMVYYAVDEENNYVQAEWLIHVAGRTHFVKNIADGTPADEIVNLRQRKSGNYAPTGVLAYHIDSDGTTRHESPVTVPAGTEADMTKVGATQVTFSTTHHFKYYPGTTDPRPDDEFVQNILVHGPITFAGATAKEEYWVNEEVNLDTVTAGFMQAFTDKEPEMTALTVTNNRGGTLTSDTAKKETVIYEAEDTITHSDAGNKETLEKEIWFYGEPSITAPDSVTVKKNSTIEELKSFIKASAKIDLPDEAGHDLTGEIVYDFSKVDLSKAGGEAELSVTYQRPDGTSRRADKKVSLVISQPPVITANNIEKNEGDPFDLFQDAGVTISDDYSNLDLSSIKVTGDLPPVDSGVLQRVGTWRVTLQAEDSEGGQATKDILIKVHSLPSTFGVIAQEDRVGDFQIWDATGFDWFEASDIPGGQPRQRHYSYYLGSDEGDGGAMDASFTKLEADGSKIPIAGTSPNDPGYYVVKYTAITPKGGLGQTSNEVLLHGNPNLSVENINVSVNYKKADQNPEKQFLEDYKDSLKISSEVVHAAYDCTTTSIDLLKEGKVSIDLSQVKFGEKGSYPAVVTATDDLLTGIDPKSVERNITISIQDYEGTLPTVTTHDIQRVSTDPVNASDDIMSYLLGSTFLDVTKGDYDISTTEVKSIMQTEGPNLTKAADGKAVPEDIDRNGNGTYENEELMQMMQTVGKYEITYRVTDKRANAVEAVAQLSVAGPAEFGFGNTDADFQKLEDVLERRQAPGGVFTVSGIQARHQDTDGSYHYMAAELSDPNADLSLDHVSVKDLAVESLHHYTTYEDGSQRPKDVKSFKVLVQGEVQFKDFSELTTFVGSTLGEDYQVEAFYQRIDESGVITEEAAAVSVDTPAVTDSRGTVEAVLRATDDKTKAPNNSITKTRTIRVNEIPSATFNDSISVQKGASKEEVIQMLDVSASYLNYKDEEVAVAGKDLEINVDSVDTGVPGKSCKVGIKVWYEEYDGTRKSVDYEAKVYVLNEPSAVVMIPASVDLRDLDDTYAGAKEEITLYAGGDDEPEKIPSVEIYPDQKIVLKAAKGSYEAFTYYGDGTKYEDPQVPIMTLEYGKAGKESGSLMIKTEIDRTKPVDTYQGTMNFTIKYGGGQP